MSFTSESSIRSEACHDMQHALQVLRAAQAEARPILLKGFWPILHPNSELYGCCTAHLKRSSKSTTLVKVFCHDSAGDFPTKVLDNIPFHDFLGEWDRRLANEALNPCNLVERQVVPVQGNNCVSPEQNDLEAPLSAYNDVFLGNVHLKDIFQEGMPPLGASPFELVKSESYRQKSDVSVDGRIDNLSVHEHGRLWMGNATHTSHLHFDAHDGLLITLFGKKTATLYEPLAHLDVIEKSKGGNHAASNPLKTPLAPSARPLCCEILPGDALYIPLYWWHLIESTESSIAINYWDYPNLSSSALKFTSLWPFTARLCTEMIQNILNQPSHPSRLALLSRQHCMTILERILRFSLHPIIQEPQTDSNIQQESSRSDTQEITSWSILVEEAIRKIRDLIALT
jgi:hypothetical protein